MTGIVNGVLIPRAALETQILGTAFYYAGVLAISAIAGLLLASLSKTLIAFVGSYTIGIVLTLLSLDLPGIFGTIPEPVSESVAITFTFTAFFPFPLLLGLVGSMIGALFTEI